MSEQTVAERLRDLRRRAGNPTQKEVAARIRCAYRSYQNWENGVTKPRWRNAVAMARYYGTTPSFILTGVDEDAPTRTELGEMDAKLDRVLALVQSLVTGEPAANPTSDRSTRRSIPDASGMDRHLAAQEAVF